TRFSPGGFSVEFGNALSGIVEAETEGRTREKQMRVGLSSVTASGTARAPIGAKAGIWGSARASNTGAMLWMNGRGNEYLRSPTSADAIGGLTLAPTPL